MSANDPMLRDDGDRALGSFLGHLVLYESNDRCDDRSSDAAPNCLTEKSTNIHAAGCITQHRQKRGEDLTSDATPYPTPKPSAKAIVNSSIAFQPPQHQ